MQKEKEKETFASLLLLLLCLTDRAASILLPNQPFPSCSDTFAIRRPIEAKQPWLREA